MEWYRKSKHISRIADIPDGEHWVAIEDHSVHVPGDQRSIDYPGHGYPAHTERSISMLLFDDKEAMESWIKHQEAQYTKRSYKILHIRTPQVKKTISVDIQ